MNDEKETLVDANPLLLQEHTDNKEDYEYMLKEEDLRLHEKWAAIKKLHERYGFAY